MDPIIKFLLVSGGSGLLAIIIRAAINQYFKTVRSKNNRIEKRVIETNKINDSLQERLGAKGDKIERLRAEKDEMRQEIYELTKKRDEWKQEAEYWKEQYKKTQSS